MTSTQTYTEKLRQKFHKNITKKWIQNDHSLKEISCVYAMLEYDIFEKTVDIAYIGSTTNLNLRYRSHNVPCKIRASGLISIMYFLPMKKGFYDYEIKLIKKLKPKFNTQHKK
jgi:hypothetical protein